MRRIVAWIVFAFALIYLTAGMLFVCRKMWLAFTEDGFWSGLWVLYQTSFVVIFVAGTAMVMFSISSRLKRGRRPDAVRPFGQNPPSGPTFLDYFEEDNQIANVHADSAETYPDRRLNKADLDTVDESDIGEIYWPKEKWSKKIRLFLWHPDWGPAGFILVFVLVVFLLRILFPELRPNADQTHCYTDWDGRGNPTICE